ncbi:MAG: PQQ-binding-like beta-propeller repeat protein, partial [Acidimicrobiia bacterium]
SSTPFTPGWDASPTIASGRVFIAGADSVAAFDVAGVSGCWGQVCAPLWSANGSYSSPAVVAGTVYLAGGDHGLAAFDAAGANHCMGTVCAPLWSATLSVGAGEKVDPPAIANGVAYVVLRGAVFAFDTVGYLRGSDRCLKNVDLCTPLWQTAPGASSTDVVAGAPSLGNRVLYAGGQDRLAAFDASGADNCAAFPKECAPLWRSAVTPTGFAAPIVVGGTLLAGSADGLHAFQPSAVTAGPTLTAVAPDASIGSTTTVTVTGTNLDAALSVAVSIPGATLGAPTVLSATAFTVAVTVPEGTAAAQYTLTVHNPDERDATRTIAVVGATSGPEVAARAGISAFPGSLWAAPADRDADAQAVAAAGVGWTALDLDWKSIQSSRTDWGWARGVLNNGGFDGAVRSARARGLQIVGTITYSPKWASPSCANQNGTYVGHCFPDAAHVVDFANFARAAAQRYGSQSTVADPLLRGSITNWQIWNEPNHQEFSLPRPDPDRYAAMLQAAYPAIKGADPAATIITGGTAPSGDAFDVGGQTEFAPTTWLLALYDRGAGNSFDAIAHHPYSFPWNPLDDADFNGFTQVRYLYLVMAAHGDGGKKVWGTEMGAPTGSVPLADPNQPCFGRSMTEAEQAQWLHDYYLGWNTTFRSFTGPLIWKATRDDPPDLTQPLNTQLWNNLGLLRVDRSPKPAFSTFQQMTGSGVSGPRQGAHCWK